MGEAVRETEAGLSSNFNVKNPCSLTLLISTGKHKSTGGMLRNYGRRKVPLKTFGKHACYNQLVA